jgi:hypothetical protein
VRLGIRPVDRCFAVGLGLGLPGQASTPCAGDIVQMAGSVGCSQCCKRVVPRVPAPVVDGHGPEANVSAAGRKKCVQHILACNLEKVSSESTSGGPLAVSVMISLACHVLMASQQVSAQQVIKRAPNTLGDRDAKYAVRPLLSTSKQCAGTP